jgi:hypothetical protein
MVNCSSRIFANGDEAVAWAEEERKGHLPAGGRNDRAEGVSKRIVERFAFRFCFVRWCVLQPQRICAV